MSEQTKGALVGVPDDVILSTYQSTKSYRAAAKKLGVPISSFHRRAAYLTSRLSNATSGQGPLCVAPRPEVAVFDDLVTAISSGARATGAQCEASARDVVRLLNVLGGMLRAKRTVDLA